MSQEMATMQRVQREIAEAMEILRKLQVFRDLDPDAFMKVLDARCKLAGAAGMLNYHTKLETP